MAETYPMPTPDRPPYSVANAVGYDGRFIIVDRNSRMVSIPPLTMAEHAKDLAEAMSEAHERRVNRERGGS